MMAGRAGCAGRTRPSAARRARPAQPALPAHRAVALVAVLWVLVLGGIVLLTVRQAARTQLALCHAELGAVEAHWLARAGVEQALAVLDDDDATADSLDEDWADDPLLFQKVSLGRGWFNVQYTEGGRTRYGLRDEGGRLNLNFAERDTLDRLDLLTDVQIDSLIDWRDGDDEPLPNGAERGYYQHLRHPYDIRNGPLQTHREVLLIRGFEEEEKFFGPASAMELVPGTAGSSASSGSSASAGGRGSAEAPGALTTVYSYESPNGPRGLPKVDLNSADPATLTERLNFTDQLAQAVTTRRGQRRFSSVMDLLDVSAQGGPGNPGSSGNPGDPSGPGRPGNAPSSAAPAVGADQRVARITLDWMAEHLEELTVSSDDRQPARLNINTAPREVLLTLPGITREVADAIIAQRGSAQGGFRRVGELLQRKVIDEQMFRAIAEKVTVRSNVFTVQSTGLGRGGVVRRILAVIDRGAQPMRFLYWYQSE